MDDLRIKVAVLEDRVQRMQEDVSMFQEELRKVVIEIKNEVATIRNQPNQVTEFITQNWKAMLLIALLLVNINPSTLAAVKAVLM